MTSFRPISPDALVALCAQRFREVPGLTVAGIDGADAADPVAFAGQVAEVLRAQGRASDVVALEHFIRPASQRLEWGAHDEEMFRTSWYDLAALRREVIEAARGRRRWLPRLWDAASDRSFRDEPRVAAPDHVLIIAGPMLSRDSLDLDVLVALRMSRAALERHTAAEHRWTIAPLLDVESTAGEPDIEVRYDHPDRPAVRTTKT